MVDSEDYLASTMGLLKIRNSHNNEGEDVRPQTGCNEKHDCVIEDNVTNLKLQSIAMLRNDMVCMRFSLLN